MNSLKDVEDVYSDEVSFRLFLTEGNGATDVDLHQEFKQKVNLMKVSYETLGAALEEYAKITKIKLGEKNQKQHFQLEGLQYYFLTYTTQNRVLSSV